MIYSYMIKPINEGLFDKFKKNKKEDKEKKEKDIKECTDKIEEYLKTGINNGSEKDCELIYYIKNTLKWSEQQLKSNLRKLKDSFKTVEDGILDYLGPKEERCYQYFIQEMPKNVKEDHKITYLYHDSDSGLIYNASNNKFYFIDFDYKRPYMEEIESLYQTAIDWKIIDESAIISEAAKNNYKVGDTISVQFNNKSYKAKIESKYKGNDIQQILSRIDNCLNAMNGNDLWNYLWNFQYQYIYGIKEEGFNSGKDLKNAITSIRLIKIGRYGELYIAGPSKFDDEHGFAIVFPKGKYIKSKYDKFNDNRDCGEDVDYIPQCTYGSDESYAIQQ